MENKKTNNTPMANDSKKEFVVNYHMNEFCNYSCEYCYAKWGIGDLKKEIHNDLDKVEILLNSLYGFFSKNHKSVRLNLVGGEPSLTKNFKPIIKIAHRIGFKIGLVTNGSVIDEDFIVNYSKYLSVIGFSIDAVSKEVMKKIGRATSSGRTLNIDLLAKKITQLRLHSPGIKIKINTVVNKNNFSHNLRSLLYKASPDKWKVFRVLPNVNPDSKITDDQYSTFLENHREFSHIMFPEDNNVMVGSYVMVDPLGRFFDNTCFDSQDAGYIYSSQITEVGAEEAFKVINFDQEKFWMRYDNENLIGKMAS